jgi:hypothetical protein
MLGTEVFMGGTSAWLPVVPVALWVFWFLPLLEKALQMSVVVWAISRARPLSWDEPSTEKSFPGLFFGGISWFSLELTNGGCQCWASIAEGQQTPTRRKKNSEDQRWAALRVM